MQKQTKKRLISVVLAAAMAISQMTPIAALADDLVPAAITEPAPDEKENATATTDPKAENKAESTPAAEEAAPAATDAAPAPETDPA